MILSLDIFSHSRTAVSIFSRHWIPKLYRKSLRDGHKNHRHEWLYLGASRCTMMFSTLCSTRLRPSPQWSQKLKRFLSCNVLLWPLQSETTYIKCMDSYTAYILWPYLLFSFGEFNSTLASLGRNQVYSAYSSQNSSTKQTAGPNSLMSYFVDLQSLPR